MKNIGVLCKLNAANVGDSAMFDSLAYLCSNVHFVPIVDSEYNKQRCLEADYSDVMRCDEFVDLDFDGLMLGGGDIDSSDILVTSLLRSNLPCLGIGLSFSLSNLISDQQWRTHKMLQRMKAIVARDNPSGDLVRLMGHQCTQSIDLAWSLPVIAVDIEDVDVSIVVREDDGRLATMADRLIKYLEAYQLTWRFVAFDPKDSYTPKSLGQLYYGQELLLKNQAATFKGVLARSRLCISLGRLHAMLFAASMGIPTIAVTYPEALSYHKMTASATTIGISHFCRNLHDTTPDDVVENVEYIFAHYNDVKYRFANLDTWRINERASPAQRVAVNQIQLAKFCSSL